MRPEVWLDRDDLRSNARAWRRRAGVPLRAVVKSSGYGWGFAALADALDAEVDGYYVADADEFAALRPLTAKPIATLADVPSAMLQPLIASGGIPTVSSAGGIAQAAAIARGRGQRVRIRVSLRHATGWAGRDFADLTAFIPLLARAPLDVECSSHITDSTLDFEQRAEFDRAREQLRAGGVSIVASDIASTAPLAERIGDGCSHVRVGIGLFGARFGATLETVCALRVRAPIVALEAARGQRTGYGTFRAPGEGWLAVLRCGYGDGFPRLRDVRSGILSVGMQYATYHSQHEFEGESVALVDRDTDIDALAQRAGIGPHQLVTALGNAARASG